jgi:hypothetical protein
VILLTGCTHKTVVSKEPLEVCFTPAHSQTSYMWMWTGKSMIPIPHTYYYGDQWQVRYLITYDDGSTAKRWVEVDQNTYEEARIALEGSAP